MSAAVLHRRGSAEYLLASLRRESHKHAAAAEELAGLLSWLELGEASPSYLYMVASTCGDLLLAFPDKQLQDFTDTDIMALLRRYPAKGRATRRAHLATFFKWAYQTRKIPSNPVDFLPPMKQPKPRARELFSDTERDALVSLPLPDGPLMRLLFEAGLRQAEARHLTGKRISFRTGMVVVKEGAKGSRDRLVPMMPPLAGALDELLTVEGIGRDDYLWYSRPGGAKGFRRRSKPIPPQSFRRWWERCFLEAGVEYKPHAGRSPHMARHHYATEWRKRGLAIDDLADNLGHASVDTTKRTYVHTKSTDIAERMRELLEAQT